MELYILYWGDNIDKSLNEIYVRDMKIIKEELTPLMQVLEEKHVDSFSVTMFLASWVKELLDEMDDDDKRELILRKMLDW